MVEPILTTFDCVPEMPRGHVRDPRVRRALAHPAFAKADADQMAHFVAVD